MGRSGLLVWMRLSCLLLMLEHLGPCSAQNNQAHNTALLAVDVEKDSEEDGSVSVEEAEVLQESFLDPNAEPFIPTHQWQIVKEGQAIPPGLHVQLNMATGERLARLMEEDTQKQDDAAEDLDPDENRLQHMKAAIEDAINEANAGQREDEAGIKYWEQEGKEGMINMKDSHFSMDELKHAMKKFKATKQEELDAEHSQERKEEIKKKFRTMEQIRKEFEDVDMQIKSELEIVLGLFERYRRPDVEVEERLAILEDLEYYVHQIDNADNFAKMGGLQLVIADLNNTVDEVRSWAAFVLGSATQSNPSVQVLALEGGALQQLIRLLSTDPSPAVSKKVLYGISTLLRNFPYAQQRFLELGGLQALIGLFGKEGTEMMRLKAVTLMDDLITEQQFTDTHRALSEEKFNQYKKVPLIETILEQSWCQLVPTLLALPDHDSREKTLGAIRTLIPYCKSHLQRVLKPLSRLRKEYEELVRQETSDLDIDSSAEQELFYHDMLLEIDGVIRLLNNVIKVEL